MVQQYSPIEFAITKTDSTYLIQLPSMLTVIEAVAFRAKYRELIEANSYITKLVLDLDQTTFMDSSAIGALVMCLKAAKSRQIELALWSVRPEILAIFALADLDRLFTIEPGTVSSDPAPIQPAVESMHPSIQSRIKRLMDIAGALVGLTITALLFVPIAIAIKLDSPGDVLFSQTRCGHLGRHFRVWKFRSMVTDAEQLKSQVQNENEGAFFKNANDPRITRVGQFLRKTSLDEFPQFWNVLRGEMSLVGTRPPLPEEVERYEVPNWQRLDVKPGITGEWQVHGRSQIRNFEEVIQLDLRYQQRWSLKYDLHLLLKTVAVLLKKDSAF
ncbi:MULTISPECIES: exopolysaccharide biosynthesis polyprenyl glycosylphosphotransferase [Leptolyngbya]|uniref:exopolysaccharide biosynthesis polyprenyl glycosylphosphotransferase n=1 Tax=Leptolyngbya TaxID=47251 RepID=UPI001684463F|nr:MULTISPECIES: exopolysaccharide biosynthesis polyprenyl glycosylphosphotransferase [unclassified Leptolyngbya]MBD1854116.1 exopolysaccharide biosynthesis polyprenyl glycosylphosphotransferase [Leptolyngbya sp. FACHB-1624]MBN8560876.1 exopolysaccharide biosynthesis polyprenyl glycosylphosphotransferase [Leptolyngbya sp. UWPOB_LEPTO1]